MPTRLLAIFLTLALIAPAVGQEHRNAAHWYRRSFESVQTLTEEEWAVIDAYRAHPSEAPSPALRDVLGRMNRAMSLARRGSRQSYCDYELAYEEGFDLPLPHLAQSRALTRVMQADAFVKLHDGDTTGAMDRVRNLYRISDHASSDTIVISSRVAQAVWNTGDAALQTALDRGLVGPGEAVLVLGVTKDMSGTDPFGYTEAVVMEQELALASLERIVLEHEDADGPGLEELLDLRFGVGLEEGDELPSTRDELEAEIDQYTALWDSVVEVFADPDTEAGLAALDRISEELRAGEHGVFAKLLRDQELNKVLELQREGETWIAARQAVLEGIAAGEIEALEEANAAVWYVRAIEALDRRAADELALLRAAERDSASRAEDRVGELLADADDVFELLSKAARMKRCDFDAVRRPDGAAVIVVPSYAPGLRDLLRLVVLDLDQAVRDRDEAAFARLRQCWIMLEHLDGDPMFATAIMTHDAFGRVTELTRLAIDAELVGTESLGELRAISGRLSHADPFGYGAATVRARADLKRYLIERIGRAIEDSDRRDRASAAVDAFDPDRLLYLGVVIDAMSVVERDEEQRADPAAAIDRLADVYDAEAWRHARVEVLAVAPLVTTEDLEALGALEVSPVAAIESRRRSVRRDLWSGLEVLPTRARAATEGGPASP